MYPHSIVAEDLAFPEGPIWMEDGSIVLVEIALGQITRVLPDGRKQVIAKPGGGPNGAAIGPDGALYVCNNGGFKWSMMDGLRIPGAQAEDYETGRIERIDLSTGKVERLYQKIEGGSLSGPNDIVFDATGGFWFTDLGKHNDMGTTYGGLYYAKADGSSITCAVRGPNMNGVGLSPDGKTVYTALTTERLVLAFDITGPGTVAPSPLGAAPGRIVTGYATRVFLDSMAIEECGNICVATIGECGISVISPEGELVEFVATDDIFTTNICWGGPDRKTAYVTLSGSGRLAAIDWARPGLKLQY